jgi:hypothetical protein
LKAAVLAVLTMQTLMMLPTPQANWTCVRSQIGEITSWTALAKAALMTKNRMMTSDVPDATFQSWFKVQNNKSVKYPYDKTVTIFH